MQRKSANGVVIEATCSVAPGGKSSFGKGKGGRRASSRGVKHDSMSCGDMFRVVPSSISVHQDVSLPGLCGYGMLCIDVYHQAHRL